MVLAQELLPFSAALCGARRVTALDIDPLALEAIQANAELNGVSVEVDCDADAVGGEPDVILAADVLYDRENMPLLRQFVSMTPIVLIADSRVRDLNAKAFIKITEKRATTWPDLDEAEEYQSVSVYIAE